MAKDVAEWIEHNKPSEMVAYVDADEKIKITVDPSDIIAGVLQANTEYWFLTEDGLLEVLMQSRLPLAKEFKKQVKEILKTIRKTGGYIADNRESEFVATYFSSFSNDTKLAMVQDLLNKKQQMQIERDEAIRTKAMIPTCLLEDLMGTWVCRAMSKFQGHWNPL